MPDSSRPEAATQARVIRLFTDTSHRDCLGYEFLGNKQYEENRCIELELLRQNLTKRGYTDALISAAIQKLELAADSTGLTLYQSNLRTYQALRYGVQVQVEVGVDHKTVDFIDWENPENNDFALAEEVTLKNGYERRPDLVLYINGLAVGVIELKRASVDIIDGIRQLNTNQEDIFNKPFFSTVQFVFAGNDSQGLKYGTVETKEKYFLTWKEEVDNPPAAEYVLDRPLAQMCEKSRLLDLIRNGIIFDAGVKKVPRSHQYLGLKKAQERLEKKEGGVIWHTQGSGKSILMVMLTKWILEHGETNARVLIITDRDELDKQIEGVMRNTGVIGEDSPSPRIANRQDFIEKIGEANPRVLCALLHKFNPDLKSAPPRVQGRFYILVDECHRTQGGNFNKQMKQWMEGAIFIGFTGTPLLRNDRKTTREVFGTNIHTYKFNEAVEDKVVLDLKYEARAVPQQLTNKQAIDDWFDRKTKGLNNFQQSVLRKRWATMEELMSAGERKQRIIASIIHDFGIVPRLDTDRGTAILVAASIYDACHYYRLLQNTLFGRYCGVITSYQPNHNSISREPPDSDERYKFDTYTNHVLTAGQTTKVYEDEMKRRFIEEPANCKLLIVVSKLLTGFDAPSCTYIYLDNEMRDHNLFQAICRTNRLDGDDKEYGHIVDFKELFTEVQNSIAVYTSDELEVDESGDDGNVTVKDWLKEGREKLDAARKAITLLCEPVKPPKEIEQYLEYFCGSVDATQEEKDEIEKLRIEFYKMAVTFLRAYAAIANDMVEAGYTATEIAAIKDDVDRYAEIRAAIKKHSGEELDLKPYESDMRHLLNTYVQADPADPIGPDDPLSLVDLIIKSGINDAIAQKLNQKGKLSKNAIAAGIINNLRKTIIREQLTDPRFYAEMSTLLNDLIKQKIEDTKSYEKFLIQAEELAKKLGGDNDSPNIPGPLIGKPDAIAIYRNMPEVAAAVTETDDGLVREEKDDDGYGDKNLERSMKIDRVMEKEANADWKGDPAREAQILNALAPIMDNDKEATLAIFEVIKQQSGYE